MLINQVGSISDTSFAPGKAPPAAPAATHPAPSQVNDAQVSEAQLKQAVDAANESMEMHSSSIEFSIDPQHGTTIVRVVDKSTGKLIRQMPSPEMVELAKALDQMKGMLIKREA